MSDQSAVPALADVGATPSPWPELPWRDWEPTISTLHLWLQIVGKVRLALAPPLNHWWHVPLYVTARGLTTSPIPTETVSSKSISTSSSTACASPTPIAP